MPDTFKLIKNAVGNGLKSAGLTKPATLIKYTPGTRTVGNLAGGTNPTSTDYSARGLVSSDKYDKIGGTLVEKNDRVVVLFGALIAGGAVPSTGDAITIEGLTQPIVDIETNSARAAYVCLCRR